MSFSVPTSVFDSRLTALKDLIDFGSGAGHVKIYTTPQPAAGAAITTQTLLLDFTLNDPCGSITNHILTFTLPESVLCLNDGDAIWGRITASDGTWCLDGDAGLNNSNSFFRLDRIDLLTGIQANITLATISETT